MMSKRRALMTALSGESYTDLERAYFDGSVYFNTGISPASYASGIIYDTSFICTTIPEINSYLFGRWETSPETNRSGVLSLINNKGKGRMVIFIGLENNTYSWYKSSLIDTQYRFYGQLGATEKYTKPTLNGENFTGWQFKAASYQPGGVIGFGGLDAESTEKFCGYMYSFKMIDPATNEEIVDYTFKKRISDGAIGRYDAVSGTFALPDAGTLLENAP